MKITLITKSLLDIDRGFVVIPVFEGEKSPFNGIISEYLTEFPKFGKLFESQLLYSKDRKLLLLGLGKKNKLNFQTLQNWVGAAYKTLSKKAKEISVILPEIENLTAEEVGKAVGIGAEIASYDFSKNYKSEYEPNKLDFMEVVVSKADRGFQDGLKKGLIIADAMNLVRRLGDMPANEMTPTYFLEVCKKVAKECKLKLTVLDEKQAKKKGMGAFCGVAQGSDEPSFMIALEYKGDLRAKDKWGFVGKGITFDTGGLNLKPGSHMEDMKYDMCGAATVLATLQAASKLGIKQNIVGVMGVTENFPGPKAQRPNDIVKTYSGKSAEILNTDAEGRLVLIDAIAFAQKDFKANKLVDLATLTGAIIVALGDFYTGAFGNDNEFTQDLILAGQRVGEKIWELPMDQDYNDMIKTEFADIANIGRGGSMPGAAGSITGAKFIEAGVEKGNLWIHLDIAGTAWDNKKKPYRNPGGTGVGVKTLVELLKG